MRNFWILAQSIAICFAAAGCAVPSPDYIENENQTEATDGAPTVNDLMHHIRCEIRGVTVLDDEGHQENAVQYLSDKNYAAQITLSLKVEDTGGLAPNLSYITNRGMFSYLLDGNLSLDRQQTYSTSYVLSMKNLLTYSESGGSPNQAKEKVTQCDDDKSDPESLSHSLSGKLGIDKIIYAGRKEIDSDKYNLTITPGVFATQPTSLPNFGSTVQFIITKGFDTGPYWKIFNFGGPSTSSKGMISGSRISTDNVIIAFASVPPATPNQKVAAAIKDLQDAVKKFDDITEPTNKKAFHSQMELGNAKARVDAAQAQYDLAIATQPLPSASAALLQNFTTNIILQNLAGSLPTATH